MFESGKMYRTGDFKFEGKVQDKIKPHEVFVSVRFLGLVILIFKIELSVQFFSMHT